MKTVSIIIPAFNEESTVGAVVASARESGLFKEVIVVDDGSKDNSAQNAQAAGAQVIRIEPNQGKANAMRQGLLLSSADVVLYWDSDLIGSTKAHFWQIVEPVLTGRAHMSVGVLSSFGQRAAPDWSGERALLTSHMQEFFDEHPDIQRFSVEQKLTNWVKAKNWSIIYERLTDIKHRQKEEKRGLVAGVRDRLRMYADIIKGR